MAEEELTLEEKKKRKNERAKRLRWIKEKIDPSKSKHADIARPWDSQPFSRIEHQILTVTDWRPQHGQDRWKYLIRLAEEADKVDDETWNITFSEDTQEWIDGVFEQFEIGEPPTEPNTIAPSREAVSTSAQAPKVIGLSQNIRDIVCNNPDIKTSELKEKLEERGLEAGQKSVSVIFSYTKSAIQHARDKGLLLEDKADGQ